MYFNAHTHETQVDEIPVLQMDNFDFSIPNSYFSQGFHPMNAQKIQADSWYFIANSIENEKCIAIGECGLDKNLGIDLELQTEVFKKQIQLSEKVKKPLILHCVKAWNECLAIKKEIKVQQNWLFHGFRKTKLIEEVIKNELFIGIGNAIFHDETLRSSLCKIPLDKILLETDMINKVGVKAVYHEVSQVLQLPTDVLEKQIEQNFRTFFNLKI